MFEYALLSLSVPLVFILLIYMVTGRHKLVVSVFYMVTWLNTQVAIDLTDVS